MIESLEDWNSRLAQCGCCEMPVCPEPTIECKSKTLSPNTFYVYGHDGTVNVTIQPCVFQCRKWKKYVITWAHSFSYSEPIPDPPSGVYKTYSSTGTATKTYERSSSISGTQTILHSGVVTYTETLYSWNSVDETWETASTIVDVTEPNETNTGWIRTRTTTLGEDPPVVTGPFPAVPTLQGNGTGTSTVTDISVARQYIRFETSTGELKHEGFDLVDDTSFFSDADTWWSGKTADSEEINGGSCYAERVYIPATTTCDGTTEEREGCFSSASDTRYFYRWVIPSEHEGSYFRIDWDEIFYPDGWDSGEPGAPTPTLTPKTFEWDGEDETGPWSLLVSTTSFGRIEVGNVRYSCYNSPFGNKPQLHVGFDTYEPPA